MKVMTARDAKNHFGEFLDSARREPVIVTKNDRPVGIMISIEDAANTLLPEISRQLLTRIAEGQKLESIQVTVGQDGNFMYA